VTNTYDYIIIGAGCAGLSLLMRMLDEPALQKKKILLIDRVPKNQNDRTWCFWEKGKGYFEPVVHHQWNKLYVKHPDGEKTLDLEGYAYKMIRSGDFYRYCFERINRASNVKVEFGEVSGIDSQKGTVAFNQSVYTAESIFSSVLLNPPQLHPDEWYLLQHFKGWVIETENDFFDPGAADLMNFRTSQEHGCTFLYVLPVSTKRALVEYTLFTEKELEPGQYDKGLRDFIANELKLTDYRIAETEQGIIPMTNMVFPAADGKVMFIGTAGGQTKASTGYTFRFIQQHSSQIVASLVNQKPIKAYPPRFRFYDSVLLRILAEQKIQGADVFYRMFCKNKAWKVLKFLDNQTHFGEELLIMHSTRKQFFIQAALREWHNLKKVNI
jgi:lycopene beta-cyclase